MNSGLRLWAPILAVSFVLAALAPSAKADVIYTYNEPTGGFSWSFEVSAILTTNQTINSFLSTTIVAGGFVANQGCASINSASADFQFSNVLVFTTGFNNGCALTFLVAFSGPPDQFGTFGDTKESGATLTISPSGVPEPSSLLLLAGGLAALLGLRRKGPS